MTNDLIKANFRWLNFLVFSRMGKEFERKAWIFCNADL
jgi:hypothetical protein